MSQSPLSSQPSQGKSSDPLSAADALPPVEPPSAGFILQLFVVPGLIVVIIVMVWLMLNWLAHMGSDPQSYVKALERNNEARWQAAVNLANALRSDRGPLKNNSQIATQIAGILDREITAGSLKEGSITLRDFLCRALGEFNVPDGLPVLLKAASTQRGPEEAAVRRAALAAIALLADNVHTAGGSLANEKLDSTLLEAANDSDPLVREVAAYAMGSVGTPELDVKLRSMLKDSYANARYNAATGLARRGDAAVVPVLVEMLDPEEMAGVVIEKDETARDSKRAVIVINALRSTDQLAKTNPTADLAPLQAAIEKLLEVKVQSQIKVQAADVLKQLQQRTPPAAWFRKQSIQHDRPASTLARSASEGIVRIAPRWRFGLV